MIKHTSKPRLWAYFIGQKQLGFSADAYAQNEEIVWEDKQAKRPELSRIYKAYENRCRKSGAMDFDDLLFSNPHSAK